MKKVCLLMSMLLMMFSAVVQAQIADKKTYLADMVAEMYKKWPDNRTLNIVFHGHSVPTGYFSGQEVHTFESYPHYMHYSLKEMFPYAVINCIRTSIGGETARKGAQRFASDVLPHKPDLLFIDYSLNDRALSLEEARSYWASMIESALENNIKVILCTPTPDTTEDITDDAAPLAAHAEQVRELAETYHVGLVDSYALFKAKALAGEDISRYMSQNNHPNAQGHRLVADEILTWFTSLSVETEGDFVDSGIDFEGVAGASASFDYNGDGVKDLIYSDGTSCRVYQNDGNGGFEKIDHRLFPAIDASTIISADIDNDGQEELLMSGLNGGQALCKVFKRTSGTQWTELTGHNLPAVYSHSNTSKQMSSTVVAADFNRDGYIDFAINGLIADGSALAGVYLNNRDNTFSPMSTDLTPGCGGGILAADLDNDGYQDLVLWGYTYTTAGGYLEVYKNQGGESFEKQGGSYAAQTWSAQVIAGDFDRDGYKDLALLSWTTQIFHNDGDMQFTSVGNKDLPNFTRCYGIVHETDTYPELIIAGLVGNLSETSLYRYNETLDLYEKTVLSGIGEYGSIVYEDMNGDGKSDLFVTGKNREAQPDAALLLGDKGSTGVEAAQQKVCYQVSPNPVEGNLYIYSPDDKMVTATLWNQAGRLCLESEVMTNGGAVDCSACTPGTYLLTVVCGQERESHKVIIK